LQSDGPGITSFKFALDYVEIVSTMPSFGSRVRARMRVGARLAAPVAAVLVAAAPAWAKPPTATTPTKSKPPSSASGFYIAGAGDGHGVGMSQYGALGFALHGFSDAQILAHYYAQTRLGTLAPGRTVTVLLHNGRAWFSGATRANGRPLNPATVYTVAIKGAELELTSGRHVAVTTAPPLTVSGQGPLTFGPHAQYRGSLVFRPNARGSIQTVNLLGIEDYVRGVVAGEMPSQWPVAALEAQAIAARSFALTAAPRSPDYDLYDDTRSQMYGGVGAETPATDAAVATTTGQVVEYDGIPVTTYFFASSGGYTEDVQNVWSGVSPEAWLQGVPDPYDDSGSNPFYRWKVSMSLAKVARKLHGLLKGAFVGVKVLKRGVSPRVVDAEVVGSGGTTPVTGITLEKTFGLMSTYMDFTTITATGTSTTGTISTPHPKPTPAATSTTPVTTSTSSTGGSGLPAGSDLRRAARAPAVAAITGSGFPAGPGTVVAAQVRRDGRFVTVARARTDAAGRYRLGVPGPGRYRVELGATIGPTVVVG
jgi:stage II sporulation protein D